MNRAFPRFTRATMTTAVTCRAFARLAPAAVMSDF